jgi:threonine dehydrogenase-like Zn-dependent dehydrogenase
MKAAILHSYGKLEFGDVENPVISDTQVLIKVTYAGICGSDQHVFKGDFHPRSKLPLIQGHEFCGEIASAGVKVHGFTAGDRVAVDPIIYCGNCPACRRKHYPACSTLALMGIDHNGGFAQYVTASSSMLYKIPDQISDEHAALVEVLAIGFHASNRAQVKQGDSIVIYGAGKVGQCILQAARTKTSARIFMVDILDNRLKLAKQGYPDITVINARFEDPVKKINEVTKGQGVDIAFEAVGDVHEFPGKATPVRACIQSIRGGGKVCVLGLSDKPVSLVMKELIFKEAQLLTSRVSHGEFKETIEALAANKLKPELLISKIMPLSEAQTAFELLEMEPHNYLKILLRIP